MAKKKTRPRPKRVHDARPDTIDFRDQMFVPTLVEVPEIMSLDHFRKTYRARTKSDVPILNQGTEGACTGFGLAAVCNFLLGTRVVVPRTEPVSPRMLYENARRYDEWQGEDYDGSSARGAMKGWYRHGVCSEDCWPYKLKKNEPKGLTNARALDAAKRPLGAYFRVNHRDMVAMHAAIAETGILYATATVHDGWDEVGSDGLIPFRSGETGGHAFAIVGYDEYGFWIQNSWGTAWGNGGFARVGYEDWLTNGYDVWVARLGAPILIEGKRNLGITQGALETAQFSFQEVRRHIISIGNDGKLRSSGTYGSTAADVAEIFNVTIPEVTKNWKTPRLLLYAHGGLVDEDGAVQRVQDYLEPLLAAEVYPVAFIWKTDLWTTLKNMLEDCAKRRRPAEMAGGAKDFLWDRIDDTLERLARIVRGQRIWSEMKENALLSTMKSGGGARLAAEKLAGSPAVKKLEVHIAAHSAGAIFMAPLVELLSRKGAIDRDSLLKSTGHRWDAAQGLGLGIKTSTLWAPACTTALFHEAYVPAIKSGRIGSTALFTLSDGAEQDDHCARIYHKSLLYLVSNALEETPRKFFSKHGEPILGMDKFIDMDPVLDDLIHKRKLIDQVVAPNSAEPGTINASCATAHGAFDDDKPTVRATLARIRGAKSSAGDFSFARSAKSARERREELITRLQEI
ncbi:MAG TPA: C1 family peptidase [Steroidobacteraceae bacterium]|nr:C1 family peptidase [Steroidobacteraceae bacterium]